MSKENKLMDWETFIPFAMIMLMQGASWFYLDERIREIERHILSQLDQLDERIRKDEKRTERVSRGPFL